MNDVTVTVLVGKPERSQLLLKRMRKTFVKKNFDYKEARKDYYCKQKVENRSLKKFSSIL
jgi:predicted nicotinamide N-methyase